MTHKDHMSAEEVAKHLASGVVKGIAEALDLHLEVDSTAEARAEFESTIYPSFLAAIKAAENDALERAAKVAELYADENLTMAGETIIADPVFLYGDFSDEAIRQSEELTISAHGHSSAYRAGTNIAAHIRSLKHKDTP